MSGVEMVKCAGTDNFFPHDPNDTKTVGLLTIPQLQFHVLVVDVTCFRLIDLLIMIVSDLNHIDRQLSMTESLNKAIAFLRGLDSDKLTEGKVEIDGQRVFALCQRYETVTADAPKFECHKKYIDVQYIVSGEEIIGWVPADRITITEEYEANKDICFGKVPKHQITSIYLGAGQLAVLYPEDGHAPRLAAGGPSTVLKIVIKVAL